VGLFSFCLGEKNSAGGLVFFTGRYPVLLNLPLSGEKDQIFLLFYNNIFPTGIFLLTFNL
jgi:hypothetical protein